MSTEYKAYKPPVAVKGIIISVIAGIFILAAGWFAIEWGYNRIYVEQGQSLLVRYKGPPLPFLPGYNKESAQKGTFAEVNEYGNPTQKGILEQLRGPGRHFYCPLWYELKIIEDKVIKPGEVGVVTCKMGNSLPQNEYLVDGDLGKTEFKGIMRKVFGPGRYRINTYAYELKIVELETIKSGSQTKHAGWVDIPTGYVGVVTNLAANPETGAKSGIQADVYPPGLYPINPKEQQIDIVEIGYREQTITASLQKDQLGNLVFDKSGEPAIADDDTGISFPSNDGFPINMDFTAIWGIMPDQAPDVIRKFGNVDAVETKVVGPQINSICRNMGSKLGAVELLEGESRQKFQEDTSLAFQAVLKDKSVTLLYGLVRHIYIPQEVRLPIQNAYIADERKLALEQLQLTTKTEAMLEEEKAKVELEAEKIRVDTEKQVALLKAEGEKTAGETKAETLQLIAAIDKETAILDAQATVLLGEAEASSLKLIEEAKSGKFKLAVEAFGSGDSYNQWVFATGLPDDMKLNLLYAGEGTFWTDLKGFSQTLLGRQTQQSQKAPTKRPTTNRSR